MQGFPALSAEVLRFLADPNSAAAILQFAQAQQQASLVQEQDPPQVTTGATSSSSSEPPLVDTNTNVPPTNPQIPTELPPTEQEKEQETGVTSTTSQVVAGDIPEEPTSATSSSTSSNSNDESKLDSKTGVEENEVVPSTGDTTGEKSSSSSASTTIDLTKDSNSGAPQPATKTVSTFGEEAEFEESHSTSPKKKTTSASGVQKQVDLKSRAELAKHKNKPALPTASASSSKTGVKSDSIEPSTTGSAAGAEANTSSTVAAGDIARKPKPGDPDHKIQKRVDPNSEPKSESNPNPKSKSESVDDE
jgi:hypothetical protein